MRPLRPALALLSLLLASAAHALYDPAPAPDLAPLQGPWQGQLTYRDYQTGQPVTLPTVMHAALSAPDTLALALRFDDGPGKVVHSYESLRIDRVHARVTWRTGLQPNAVLTARLVEDRQDGDTRHLVFEPDTGGKRSTLDASPQRWVLTHEERDAADGEWRVRSRYTLGRTGR